MGRASAWEADDASLAPRRQSTSLTQDLLILREVLGNLELPKMKWVLLGALSSPFGGEVNVIAPDGENLLTMLAKVAKGHTRIRACCRGFDVRRRVRSAKAAVPQEGAGVVRWRPGVGFGTQRGHQTFAGHGVAQLARFLLPLLWRSVPRGERAREAKDKRRLSPVQQFKGQCCLSTLHANAWACQ